MVGYNLFLILFYVVLILQRIQIDQDGITFFVIKHIFKKISRNEISTIEKRGTTFYAILDAEGGVLCLLDKRKKIKKCLEMYNIEITKR